MKKKLLFWTISGLILLSLIPLFRRDFFHLHDFSHVTRLVELDKAIKDGYFPPRWSKDLGWGYGMPLFQFYAPLPYFISEFFHLLGLSFLTSIKICFGLTAFISFWGMFVFARKFWGLQGAILAGLAFVYSPYRAVDFYVRGALGELYAISLIPWVLWGITEIIDFKRKQTNCILKRKISLTAILLGLFFLSHTVLNLICFPLYLLFSLFYALISKAGKKSFPKLLITFFLGISLAAFFLIPAFFEKKFASVEKLTSGYSHYSHHFLYFRQFIWGNWGYAGSVDGIEDGMSFHLGKVHLLLSALTLIWSIAFLVKKKKIKKRMFLVLFFSVLVFFLAFLSTYHAKAVWDAIPLMAFIQFPWRFNSFIIVLICFLCGGTLFCLKKFSKKITYVFIFLSIVLILKVNVGYFRPEKYVNPQDNYYTDENLIKSAMSGVIPDYLPIWVKDQPPIANTDFKILSGDAQIKVLESKTQKLTLKVENTGLSKIKLNRFYFPGWQVLVDGKKLEFAYKEDNGIITVDLPQGNYLLELVFKDTAIRTITNIVSIMSLFVVIFLLSDFKKIKKFQWGR